MRLLVDVAYHSVTVPGGGERHALYTARELARLGHRVRLVTCGFDEEVARALGVPPRGFEVVDLGPCPGRGAARLARYARAFRGYRSDADVLLKFQGLFSYLARGGGAGVLYSLSPPRFVYDDSILAAMGALGAAVRAARPLFRLVDRRLALSGVSVVAANSRVVAGRVERAYGVPRRLVEVVYPPVDTGRYRFREFGDFYLLVSRLEWHKRVHVAVKAFELLPRERLVIVGDGPLRRALEAYVRGRGLGNVEVLGRVPEEVLLDLYSRARAVVYLPANEDFGLVPVEAAASGKPTIAADEGGLREAVVHGETGLLVKPTPREVAGAVELLSRRDDLLEEMKPKCLAWARRFGLDEYRRRLGRILNRAAGAAAVG